MTLSYDDRDQLGRSFHACLLSRDWKALRALLHDDASWTLPGDNMVSGSAEGGDAVVERAQLIASYGVRFELLHILLSREHMALLLHNTARRGDLELDEHLATVCRLRGSRIIDIETYLSEVRGMDAFFAELPT
ncbi:MAG TPA: nuclear transport factor 2 family protein [Allosphingosinicella sp.]|jgi:hypothetical protein